jgi:hypothetical protein
MNAAGIFIFGVFVFAFVAAACVLIAYGIVAERRDRQALEAEQARALRSAPGARPARARSGPSARASGRSAEAGAATD